jgi:PKD repeat protein
MFKKISFQTLGAAVSMAMTASMLLVSSPAYASCATQYPAIGVIGAVGSSQNGMTKITLNNIDVYNPSVLSSASANLDQYNTLATAYRQNNYQVPSQYAYIPASGDSVTNARAQIASAGITVNSTAFSAITYNSGDIVVVGPPSGAACSPYGFVGFFGQDGTIRSAIATENQYLGYSYGNENLSLAAGVGNSCTAATSVNGTTCQVPITYTLSGNSSYPLNPGSTQTISNSAHFSQINLIQSTYTTLAQYVVVSDFSPIQVTHVLKFNAVSSTVTGQYSLTASPSSGQAPLAAYFFALGSAMTSIDFGDGQTLNAPSMNSCSNGTACNQWTPTHTYNSPGTYVVKLINGYVNGLPQVVATATVIVNPSAQQTTYIPPPTSVTPATAGSVQTQLVALLAELQQLQQQIAQVQGTPTTSAPPVSHGNVPCPSPALTRGLSRGMTGTDVAALQGFLINMGYLTGTGPTGYFGALTEAALQRFQAAQGIASSGTPATTGYGAAGPRTRYAIMQVCTPGYSSTPVNQQPITTPLPLPTYTPPVQQVTAQFTTFTANPSQITVGQQSTLTWNVQNASGCVLSQQVPGQASVVVNVNLPVSGTALVSPGTSIIYTIVCTAVGIQNVGATQSIGVTVTGQPVTSSTSNYPHLAITASPSTINVKDSTTVAWDAVNISSCSLTSSPNIFSSNTTSGSQTSVFNTVGTTTFTFTCTSGSQSYASTTQVVVRSMPNSIIATPATGTAPLYVTFNGVMGNTYNGSLLLDYGDGNNVTVCAAGAACNTFTVYHTYANVGTYVPSLTVVSSSGNTSLGSTQIVVSPPAAPQPTLVTNQSSYSIGDTVLATWNVPGNTYPTDWVTYVPQGLSWNAGTFPPNQPKFITDGAHSWTKSLIPISTGTFELTYLSQGGYGVVVRSAPFTVLPLFFQLVGDRTTVTAGGIVNVTWKNPYSPAPNDWITMVPSGAHYSTSTWPTGVFPSVYTGGAAAGTKALQASAVPGAYDIVYYASSTFVEIARSTSTVMVQ